MNSIVPAFIWRRIEGRSNLQKIFNNISWLFFDKVFRMGLALFVGVWLARYLGPEKFGLLNYALAFVSLFGFSASLGLQGIAVRDIVREPNKAGETLGTSFVLMLGGGIAAFMLAVSVIWIIRPDDLLTKLFVSILGFSFIFKSSDVIKYWFESQVESRYVVLVENGAYVVIASVKIIMILKEVPILAFVWAFFAEAFLVGAGLFLAYLKKEGRFNEWSFKAERAKVLLKDSWPLMISIMMASIYMRIDQIMLREMIDANAVGLYASAVKISESLYFIPAMLTASFFPSIINAKKDGEKRFLTRLQNFYVLIIWIFILTALPITFFSRKIIYLLYGAQYIGAESVLMIHIWAGVFMAIGFASSRWFIIENIQNLSAIFITFGALTNILLNYYLIPVSGMKGAAIATIFSQGVAFYFSLALHRKTRGNFILLSKAFNPIILFNKNKLIF